MSRQPAPAKRAESSKRRAHAPDYLLLTTVLVLAIIGLIAVYSSSYALGATQFDDANYFVKRQGAFLLVGVVVMFIAMRFPYHLLRGLSPLLMLAALVGLMAVLLVGTESNGSQRWPGRPANSTPCCTSTWPRPPRRAPGWWPNTGAASCAPLPITGCSRVGCWPPTASGSTTTTS